MMTKAGPCLGTVRELQVDRQTDRHIFGAIESIVCALRYDDKGRPIHWNRHRVADRQTELWADRDEGLCFDVV